MSWLSKRFKKDIGIIDPAGKAIRKSTGGSLQNPLNFGGTIPSKPSAAAGSVKPTGQLMAAPGGVTTLPGSGGRPNVGWAPPQNMMRPPAGAGPAMAPPGAPMGAPPAAPAPPMPNPAIQASANPQVQQALISQLRGAGAQAPMGQPIQAGPTMQPAPMKYSGRIVK